MASSRWPRWFKHTLGSKRSPKSSARRVRPTLDLLEDRTAPATFVVTNILDNGFDANGGPSLRQAIRDANATPGFDRILFDIPTNPSQPQIFSIRLATELPALTDPAGLVIDATSQPGFAQLGNRPVIELTGAFRNPGFTSDTGFTLGPTSSNNLIRGFIINSFPDGAIHIDGSDNNIIVGNWLGLDINGDVGTDPLNPNQTPNTQFQILIDNGASGNIIGGTVDRDGNPLFDAGGELIGGTLETNRNILSGTPEIDIFGTAPNGQGVGPGVRIQNPGTEFNLIQGNFIGTNAAGTAAIPNYNGIEILNSAHNNFIGHPLVPEAQNLIRFNLNDGVRLGPSPFPLPAPAGSLLPQGTDTEVFDYFEARALNAQDPAFPLIDYTTRDARTDVFTELGAGVRGSRLILRGFGFTPVVSVTVGGVPAEFRAVSDSELEIIIPTDAGPQLQAVVVQTPETQYNSADRNEFFRVLPSPTPIFDDFFPFLDPVGNPITQVSRGEEFLLNGFGFLSASQVLVGNVPAEYEILNDSAVRVRVPNAAVQGANQITVLVPGSDPAVSPTTLNVMQTQAPSILALSSTLGSVGTRLTIYGQNFFGATEVRFNGVPTTEFTVDQTTGGIRIDVTVPVGATTGLVSVLTPGGLAVSQETFSVTGSVVPEITSFDPGGFVMERIGITGSGFLGTQDVLFNGVRALEVEVVNDNRIEVVVPAGASSGPLTVVTPGGSTSTAGVLRGDFVVLEEAGLFVESPISPVPSTFGPNLPNPLPSFGPDQDAQGPVGSLLTLVMENSFTVRAVHFVEEGDLLFSTFDDTVVSVERFDPLTNPRGFDYIPPSPTVPARILVEVPDNVALGENLIIVETVGNPPAARDFRPRPPFFDDPAEPGNPRRYGSTEVTYFSPPIDAELVNLIDPPIPYLIGDETLPTDESVSFTYGARFRVTPNPRATITSFSDNFLADGPTAGIRGTEQYPGYFASIPGTESGQLFELFDLYNGSNPFGGGPVPGIVRVQGGGFLGATAVRIGGVDADIFSVESDSELYFVVPTDAPAGAQLIEILTPGPGPFEPDQVVVSGASYTILDSPNPTFDVISASSGLIGSFVDIDGTGFTGTSRVSINGVDAEFQVRRDDLIRVRVPFTFGTDGFLVETPGGTVQTTDFTAIGGVPDGEPTVAMNNPIVDFDDDTGTANGAPIAGGLVGQRIRIFGTNFFPAHVIPGAVTFQGPGNERIPAENVVAINNGTLEVTVPERADDGGILIMYNKMNMVMTPNFDVMDEEDPQAFFLATSLEGQPVNIQVSANAIFENGSDVPFDRSIDYFTGLETPVEPIYPPAAGNDLLDLDTEVFDSQFTLSGGPNRGQNYPLLQVVQSAIDRTVFPTALVSQPFREYRIDFYENSADAFALNANITETFLGSIFIQTDDEGFGSGLFVLRAEDSPDGAPLDLGTQITAVATDLTPGSTTGISGLTQQVIESPRGDGSSRVSVSQAVDPATGGITGFKFFDENGDGFLDPGEPGLAGVSIELDLDDDGTVDATQVTNQNGAYTFTMATLGGLGLPNGTHRVTEVVPPGLEPSNPVSGSQLVTIINGEVQTDVNFLNREGNEPPVAVNDSFATPFNVPLVIAGPGILGNDTDPEGDPLSVASPDAIALLTGEGTLTVGFDGGFTYTPTSGFSGTASFEYQATDGNGLSNIATVSIEVFPEGMTPPGFPVANDDSFTTESGQTLSPEAPGILANDTDPDGDLLMVFSPMGITLTQGEGTLVVNADGSFTYTAPVDFTGTAAFEYRVTDGANTSFPANVTIEVSEPGTATPTANNDEYNTPQDTTLTIAPSGILANDTDPNGDPLSVFNPTGITLVSGQGTLTVNADGSFTYIPSPGFIGISTFQYQATDGSNVSNVATVTINVTEVTPITTAPIAYLANGGSAGDVSIYGADQNGISFLQNTIQPLGAFPGEVRVATADVDGDGVVDILAAAGPGGGPRVTVLDGNSGAVLRDFFAYEDSFTGGIYIAAADLNDDGFGDFVVGADLGGGPRIRVFDGRTNLILGDFFAYELTFTGGVRVGIADFNNDGTPDIVAGAGFLGGPRVTVFDGNDPTGNTRLADFFAFEATQRDGVHVAGGDVNGDGFDDLIVGAGPGGGPRVRVFDGQVGSLIPNNPPELFNFFAFNPNGRPGVRVAAEDLNNDGLDDIIVGQGPGEGNLIRTYDSATFSMDGEPTLIEEFLLADSAFSVSGVWVG